MVDGPTSLGRVGSFLKSFGGSSRGILRTFDVYSLFDSGTWEISSVPNRELGEGRKDGLVSTRGLVCPGRLAKDEQPENLSEGECN